MKRKRLSAAEQRQRAAQALWRKLHPDYGKEWRRKNRKRVRDLKRRWRSDPENAKREAAWALARKLRD